MAGVAQGQKRGPYSKRVKIDDLSNLAGEQSASLREFLSEISDEAIISLRKAARKQKLTDNQLELVESFYHI